MKKNMEHGFMPSADDSKEKGQELKKREILEQREVLILEQKCFETYKKLIGSQGRDKYDIFWTLGNDITKYIDEITHQIFKMGNHSQSHASNYDFAVAKNTAAEWAKEVFQPMTEISLFDYTTYFDRGGSSKDTYIWMAKEDPNSGAYTNCPAMQPRY